MALYGFKSRFVPRIEDGTKRQTIRSPRKRMGNHGKVGGPITLTTGSRFKPRCIGRSTIRDIHKLTMNLALGDVLLVNATSLHHERITGRIHLNAFAFRDGFDDWADMLAFWAAEHPGLTLFQGIMTTWGDLH